MQMREIPKVELFAYSSTAKSSLQKQCMPDIVHKMLIFFVQVLRMPSVTKTLKKTLGRPFCLCK